MVTIIGLNGLAKGEQLTMVQPTLLEINGIVKR